MWSDLLTLMALAGNPESSEEQISHNRLLINMKVQSIQQIKSDSDLSETQRTRLPKLHSQVLPTSVYHGPCAIEGVA